MSKDRKVLRCAVYTRKSSDEGLEQSFNSLDAQREASDGCTSAASRLGASSKRSHHPGPSATAAASAIVIVLAVPST